jgi:hypothetical protein
MSIDWNWFFSSFCQSAAALIGIIGAFIISRLLGLSEKIGSTISQFDNLVIERSRIIASISNRRFIWYTKTNIKYGSDIKKAIRDGEYDNLDNGDILKKIYETDSRLYKNDEAVLIVFKELYESNRPKRTATKLGYGFSMINTQPITFDIPPVGIWDKLNKEKEAIDNLEIESKAIIQHFHQNLQDLNSFEDTVRPLRVIIIILIIAFPITVIYPLHFMPMQTGENPILAFNLFTILKTLISLKSVLLIAFFATIEGIFYYFLTLTDQLNNRLATAIQNNSDDLKSIKNYSKYFDQE